MTFDYPVAGSSGDLDPDDLVTVSLPFAFPTISTLLTIRVLIKKLTPFLAFQTVEEYISRRQELDDLYLKSQALCVQLCKQQGLPICDLMEKLYATEDAPMRSLHFTTQLTSSNPDWGFHKVVWRLTVPLLCIIVLFYVICAANSMLGILVGDFDRRRRRIARRRRRAEREWG